MSITKTLLAGVAGTVLVGSGAMASEPLKLTDSQMDDVSAGFVISQAIAPFVVLNSFLGTAGATTSVATFAEDSIIVRPCGLQVAIKEFGTASSNMAGFFDGGGGIATLDGSSALVTNGFVNGL